MTENKNIAVIKPAKAVTFSTFMSSDAVKQKVNEIIGGKDGQRFITTIISAVSTNPNLAKCEHSTILSAALQGEALKLSPSNQLGHYYLVPYDDNKNHRMVAQFQMGYKGYIQLAMRSGQYRDLDVMDIREGEYKGKDKYTGKPVIEFIEDDGTREDMPIVGYFVYFELLNGFRKSLYWSRAKMEKHAMQYSKGYASDVKKGNQYTFWSKDFNGMAYKTMLRQLLSKWGVMSIEMQNAIASDMAVINDNGYEYVDNQSEDTTPEQTPEERYAAIPLDDEIPNFDEKTGEIIEEPEPEEPKAPEAPAEQPQQQTIAF